MATNAKPEAPPPPSDPDLLHKPIRVRGGTTFEIRKEGLKVISKKHFLAKAHAQTIMWHTIKTCELASGCFTATLTLKGETGRTEVIKGYVGGMQEVAHLVYEQMSGTHDKVDESITKACGRKVKLLGNGVIVKKRTGGCCQGIATFVPWGAVVLAQNNTGLVYNTINIRTLVREEDMDAMVCKNKAKAANSMRNMTGKDAQLKAATNNSKDASATAAAKKAKEAEDLKKKKAHGGPNFVEATIWVRKPEAANLYEHIVKLMRCGQPETPLPDAPEVKRTHISSSGVETETMLHRTFVPWRAVTSVDYVKPLVGKGKVIITDRVGTVLMLKGFVKEQYDVLRNIYAKRGKESLQDRGIDGVAPPAIIRKRVRISTEGVDVGQWHLLKYDYHFYPWTEIDGVEMTTNCCCGGGIHLITESGNIIDAYHSYFASRPVIEEVLVRIREMKYKFNANPAGETSVVFAGKLGSSRACVLTDVSLRLVQRIHYFKSIVCLLDLDSVQEVKVVTKSGMLGRTHYLVVGIDKKMGKSMLIDDAMKEYAKLDKVKADDQVIIVKLLRTDNANQLKAEILKRANARKKAEK